MLPIDGCLEPTPFTIDGFHSKQWNIFENLLQNSKVLTNSWINEWVKSFRQHVDIGITTLHSSCSHTRKPKHTHTCVCVCVFDGNRNVPGPAAQAIWPPTYSKQFSTRPPAGPLCLASLHWLPTHTSHTHIVLQRGGGSHTRYQSFQL